MVPSSPFRQLLDLVPEDVIPPMWSVVTLTYNCSKYLKGTLEIVLQQDLGSDIMSIMVIDDCSTEDYPESIIHEVEQGRVEFYQQSKNVGLTKHFRTSLEISW